MADIKINPQSDDPQDEESKKTGEEPAGSYKFGESEGEMEAESSSPAGLIGAESAKSEEEKTESEPPEAEEQTSTGDASEEAEPESDEEEESEESGMEEEEKKGLPKAVLIGIGIVVLAGIAAGVYYGSGLLFRGQVPPEDLIEIEAEQKPIAQLRELTCATDEYYDPGDPLWSTASADISGEMESTRSVVPQLDTSNLLNALPDTKAQVLNPSLDMPIEEMAVTTSTGAAAQTEETLDDSFVMDLTLDETDGDILGEIAPSAEGVVTDAIRQTDIMREIAPADTDTSDTTEEFNMEIVRQLSTEGRDGTTAGDTTEETVTEVETGLTKQLAPAAEEAIMAESTVTDFIATERTATPTTDFDPDLCKPIDRKDCDLLELLKADPEYYYLHADTVDRLDEWLAACPGTLELGLRPAPSDVVVTEEEPVLPTLEPTCGVNQIVVNGVCECSEGYFDISSVSLSKEELLACTNILSDGLDAPENVRVVDGELMQAQLTPIDTQTLELVPTETQTITLEETETPTLTLREADSAVTDDDDTEMTRISPTLDIQAGQKKTIDSLAEAGRLICVNCRELQCIIDSKMQELSALQQPIAPTDMITDLAAEATAIKSEISTLEQILIEQGCVEEKTPCEVFLESAKDLLNQGDLRGSYDNQISLIRNDCSRDYNDCEELLAIAKLAQEYADLAATMDPDNVKFFEDQAQQYKDAYYTNEDCIDCDEIEATTVDTTDRIEIVESVTPKLDVLTIDPEDVRTDADTAARVVDAITKKPIYSPDTGAYSQNNLQDNIDSYIEKKGITTEEEKASLLEEYCGPPEREIPPDDDDTYIPPDDDDTYIPPDDDDTYIPPDDDDEIPPPEITTEPGPTPGGREDGYVPPTEEEIPPVEEEVPPVEVPPIEVVTPEEPLVAEVVQPPLTQPVIEPELRPAAPEEFELTEEAAPPDIYPVGPETMIYVFAIIASQLYIFRRKIYAYIRNK